MPDNVNTIPNVLLQTVLEANEGRLTRFCSKHCVMDHTSDPRTAEIYLLIQLIKAKMNNEMA